MLLMPFCLVRLGVKATLLVGMGAWALRYVLFAFGNAHELLWMLLIGMPCTGSATTSFSCRTDIHGCQGRDSLQGRCTGLITMATYGVGMLIGFSLAGMVSDAYVQAGIHDWRAIWLYPAAFAAVVFAPRAEFQE